ncbi:MAG: histidine kinase, partial [Pseudomonadota bacterium]|nr:histidine kinase [Pseudomonadota bacterium]
MTLSPLTAALIALAAGAWLAVAVWAGIRATRREAAASRVICDNVRLAVLLQSAPALPLVIAPDGTISGSDRLAGALGMPELPARWMGLFGDGAPFDP